MEHFSGYYLDNKKIQDRTIDKLIRLGYLAKRNMTETIRWQKVVHVYVVRTDKEIEFK